DTVVTLNGQILGKPTDAAHALEILRSLQGVTHQVVTGFNLTSRREGYSESLTRNTKVSFTTWPDSVLTAYIKTGEPLDKSGAYGIQSRGGFLVEKIQGSCSNVIGLPMQACITELMRFQVIAPLQ
ncbi:MAG: septum formation inhibitor Maf, partial [Candidatus Electrothrix sp. AR3]|nr:septum formation inhibitor Maf [Candidatus Electrothrix sp. AR3]